MFKLTPNHPYVMLQDKLELTHEMNILFLKNVSFIPINQI